MAGFHDTHRTMLESREALLEAKAAERAALKEAEALKDEFLDAMKDFKASWNDKQAAVERRLGEASVAIRREGKRYADASHAFAKLLASDVHGILQNHASLDDDGAQEASSPA